MATKDELLAQQAQARKAGATPVGLQSQNPYAAPQVSTPSNNQSTLQNLSSQRSFGAGAPAVRANQGQVTAGMQTMGQRAGIPGPYQRTPVGAVSGGAPPRVASPQQQSNLYTYGMYGPGSGFDPTARYRQADAQRTVGQMNRYAQQRALLELAKSRRAGTSGTQGLSLEDAQNIDTGKLRDRIEKKYGYMTDEQKDQLMKREVYERTEKGHTEAVLRKRIDSKYKNLSDEEKEEILKREMAERGYGE